VWFDVKTTAEVGRVRHDRMRSVTRDVAFVTARTDGPRRGTLYHNNPQIRARGAAGGPRLA